MRVRLDWHAEGSGQTEIGKLYHLTVLADEQVLRLQITMEDAVRVQEHERLENLIRERLRLLWRKRRTLLLHVFLEIVFQVLENEVQLLLAK